MTAAHRLGLSLAVVAGLGGVLFVAAEWWWRAPPELPQAQADKRAANEAPSEREERMAALREAIEEQRAALRAARDQRGMASEELERVADELGAIRERLEGLRDQVDKAEPEPTR